MTEEARKRVEALRMCPVPGFGCCDCPVYIPGQTCQNELKAAALIESLSAQLDQVTRERDAAVKDIRNAAFCGCHVCKHYYRPDQNVRKYACKKYGSFDEHDFIADDGSIYARPIESYRVETQVAGCSQLEKVRIEGVKMKSGSLFVNMGFVV